MDLDEFMGEVTKVTGISDERAEEAYGYLDSAGLLPAAGAADIDVEALREKLLQAHDYAETGDGQYADKYIRQALRMVTIPLPTEEEEVMSTAGVKEPLSEGEE